MKPLFVLLISFAIALAATGLINGTANFYFSGTVAMSAMLVFTSIGHFAFSKGMALMLPGFMPFKKQIVIASGLLEIIFAIALLLPVWRHTTAILLIFFFICILPANIYGAIKKIDLQQADYTGSGINYLWFRIPLQILFIAWLCWFSL